MRPFNVISNISSTHPGVYMLLHNAGDRLWMGEGVVRKLIGDSQYTLLFFQDGIPVAVMGGSVLWRGVGEIWMVLDHEKLHNLKGFVREVSRHVGSFSQTHGLHRVQAVCEDVPGYPKFLEAIGLCHECTMEKAGATTGEDMLIYRRLY